MAKARLPKPLYTDLLAKVSAANPRIVVPLASYGAALNLRQQLHRAINRWYDYWHGVGEVRTANQYNDITITVKENTVVLTHDSTKEFLIQYVDAGGNLLRQEILGGGEGEPTDATAAAQGDVVIDKGKPIF